MIILILRKPMRITLMSKNYEVITAYDGDEGLAADLLLRVKSCLN